MVPVRTREHTLYPFMDVHVSPCQVSRVQTVVYCTRSAHPEENEQLVRRVLERIHTPPKLLPFRYTSNHLLSTFLSSQYSTGSSQYHRINVLGLRQDQRQY